MLRLTRKFGRKPAGTPADRRAHRRHETNIETVCRPVAEEAEFPARVLDVSLGGIKLRVSCSVREGTMIRVNLPKVGGPHTTMLACVMHVRSVGKDRWEIGCNFSLELSGEEIQAFGGEKTPTAPGDLRAWVRHPARGFVEFRPLPGGEGPPKVGELVNLSPAGVGLVVEEKLEPGTAMTVSLKRLDDRPDRSVLACVVYQNERPDGKWAVGCNFLHQLSQKELEELLWTSSF